MGTMRAGLDHVKAVTGEPAYEWGLVGVAAVAAAAGAWGLDTLVRLVDTPIITVIN
jgi:hypothetical protein